MKTKTTFSVGDVVICSVYDKGVVTCINATGNYPITVEFIEATHTYTKNGTFYELHEQESGDPYIRKLTKLDRALK